MTDEAYDADPARTLLPPDDYRNVCAVAADVVRLYGGDGPPFPILKLMGLLEPSTRLLSKTDEYHKYVYGYAFPLDFSVHHKHAALFLDPHGPMAEVFVTLFHEAGHVLLHILPNRFPADRRHDRRAEARPRPGKQAEVEADLFARLTTMPAAWIYAHWPYACTIGETMDDAVAWMAMLFSVPETWMRLRLASLGLLPGR